MINQNYDALNDQFLVENLYEQCSGITYSPDFKNFFTYDGKLYTLKVFKKNKRYSDYPVELSYTRQLKNEKYTISSDINQIINREEQIFKIYAEKCEIQMNF